MPYHIKYMLSVIAIIAFMTAFGLGSADAQAPSAPSTVNADGTTNSVEITWSSVGAATSYNVYRSTTSGGESSYATGITATAYTDSSVSNGSRYYYTVASLDGGGTSSQSVQTYAYSLAAPTGLAAHQGNGAITLTWSAATSAGSYNVYRSTTSGGESTATYVSVCGLSFTDNAVANGTAYYYKVTAVYGSGAYSPLAESALSSEASTAPSATLPIEPAGFAAVPGSANVVLSWTTVSGATSYNVKRGTASGGAYTTLGSPTSTSYTDTSATSGTTYYYVVTAVNAVGEGSNSSQATANITYVNSLADLSDTFSREGVPTENEGGQAFVWTADTTNSTNRDIYLRFDLTGAAGLISAATLKLYEVSGGSCTEDVYGVSDNTWSEYGLDWSNAPSLGSVEGSATAGSNNAYLVFDVSSYVVAAQAAGDSQVDMAIDDTSTSAGLIQFYSRENGTDPPQLLVTVGAPLAPTGVSAVSGPYAAENTLTWTATPGATSYNIYRGTSSGGESGTAVATGVTSASYADTGLTPDMAYYYKVSAVDQNGEGTKSGEVYATPTSAPPTVATAASAFHNPVTGTTTSLSVLGAWSGPGGASSLTYTWSSVGPASVTYSANGTNAAKSSTATFSEAGTYTFTVTIASTDGGTVTSAVTVTVNQTLTTISVSPSSVTLGTTVTQTFAATGKDQFGNALTTQPSFTWAIAGPGVGSINSTTGLYHSGPSAGTAVVKAARTPVGGTASVTVASASPTNVTALPGNTSVAISWTTVPGDTSYFVERGTARSGPFTSVATVTPGYYQYTYYLDTSVTNGQKYYYQVAVDVSGTPTDESSVVSATPDPPATTAISCGATLSGSVPGLTYDPYAMGLSSDLNAIPFEFTATSGTTVTFTASSWPFQFTLYNSSWSELSTGNSVFSYSITTTGNYIVDLTHGTADGLPPYPISPYSVTMTCGVTPPATPTGLTGTAGTEQVILAWTASAGATGYHVWRNSDTIATVTSGTAYTDTGLAPLEYSYTVSAYITGSADSAQTSPVTAIPTAPSGTPAYQIAAAAAIAPGSDDAPFTSDAPFLSGSPSYFTTSEAISTTGVTDPAPTAVYQSERQSTSSDVTYTLPGLEPSTTYMLRLHFAEQDYTTPGEREFDVKINGTTTILSDFDILAAAGAPYQAVVEQFDVPTDSGGTLTIALHNDVADSSISGVEVITGSGTLPNTPYALLGTPGNGQVVLNWSGSNATGYNVKRATSAGGTYSTIASDIASSAYTDTGLTDNAIYYYKVSGVNTTGEGSNSPVTAAMPVADTYFQINCGDGGSVGSWVADTDFSGGSTGSAYDTGVYASSAGLVNPAPFAVYQSQRSGASTYTLTGLSAGSYTVRLHFAEIDPTVVLAGERYFNVGINGTNVLSNFDIVQAAGGPNVPVIEQFSASPASGDITVALTAVSSKGPVINGIEVVSGTAAPNPPFALNAEAGTTQVVLTWDASAGASSFNVERGTTSGGPYSSIATPAGSAVSYTDTSVSNGTTYYYVVSAVAGSLSSANSNQASATPTLGSGGSPVIQINAGGGLVGTFVADTDMTGGTTDTTAAPIDTTGLANAAPEAVYQSRRDDSAGFNYNITGLTASAAYTVRLHFAEYVSPYEGYPAFSEDRLENITINGTQVATDFSPIQAAGTVDRAVTEQFNTTADGSGQIDVVFAAASSANCEVSGLEVLSGDSAPSAPNNLNAIPDNNKVSLYWDTNVAGATSYNVMRGTVSGGSYSALATGVTAAGYTDTAASNSTTYYYVVTGVNTTGTSANSNEAAAEPLSAGAEDYRISAGGYLNAPYAEDQYYVYGQANTIESYISPGQTFTEDTSLVTNPAPTAVYEERRATGSGPPFSYVFPNLTPSEQYTVRLHFSEFAESVPNERFFDVAVNGTTVLSDFNIFAVAHKEYTAIAIPIVTTADASGKITLLFTAEQEFAMVNGVEVLTGNTYAPGPPLDLQAAQGNTQVGLTWEAPAGLSGSVTYNVLRSTVSGGPYSSIATGVSTTSYSDTTTATDYYVVTAVNTNGTSIDSNEATPTPPFTLSVAPASTTVDQGSCAAAVVTASSSIGFTSPITITESVTGGTPSGLTMGTYPSVLTIAAQAPYPISSATGAAHLNFNAGGSTATGTYTVTVTGTAGDYTALATTSLVVAP